ncbi:hypothetical protein K7X08_035784 [Anisodus acutangulus]|uniref:Uncharacterized protein n=1 Tax=Anisodus acutangulus TaxID=402998 RepID=A0A9Q1LTC3_9SOLA|nr:hypothetical protein K7X08_035784 [Anisodus acutangulus]
MLWLSGVWSLSGTCTGVCYCSDCAERRECYALAKVDATEDYDVQGYPTVFFFMDGLFTSPTMLKGIRIIIADVLLIGGPELISLWSKMLMNLI